MDIFEILKTSPFNFWLVVSAAFLLTLFIKLKSISGKQSASKYSYTKKKYFMTRAESEFYNALISAVGKEFYIFAQVHLPTLVDHKIKGQNWQGARSHINRKSVDFVLCDKTHISPVLAIELDDRSHLSEVRKVRDREVERILTEAGMPLLRIENHGAFDINNLATSIKQKLA